MKRVEVDTRAGFGYHAVGKARVAELVDARDLKSLGVMHRAGSIPAPGTNKIEPSTDSPTRFLCIYHGCIKLGF